MKTWFAGGNSEIGFSRCCELAMTEFEGKVELSFNGGLSR